MNKENLISRITLGTVQLGMDYGIANKTGKPSQEAANEILKTAFESGITSFDTSIEYGDSEVILGNYFSQYTKEGKPFISTKFKLPPDAVGSEADIEKTIYGFCEKSLKRLKIEKIPLYMLHNPYDMTRFGKTVPKTIQRLITQGYIKEAGVSVYTVDEAKEMMKYDVYTSIQLPMNIFDTRFIKSGMIRTLANREIRIYVRSVFLQGLFFMQPDLLPESFTNAAYYIRQLGSFSKKEGMSIAQLAFSYINGIEGVTSIVLGAETKEQISENTSLLSSGGLAQQKRESIDALFKDIPIEDIMRAIIGKKKS